MVCMNPDMHQHLSLMLRDSLNPLVALLDDPMVREVMINGADDVWNALANIDLSLSIVRSKDSRS